MFFCRNKYHISEKYGLMYLFDCYRYPVRRIKEFKAEWRCNCSAFYIGELMPYYPSTISLKLWRPFAGYLALYCTSPTDKYHTHLLMQYNNDTSLSHLLDEPNIDFIDRRNTIAIINPEITTQIHDLNDLVTYRDLIVWYNHLLILAKKSNKHKHFWEIVLCTQEWYDPSVKTWIVHADVYYDIPYERTVAFNVLDKYLICWTKEGDDNFYPLLPDKLICEAIDKSYKCKVLSVGKTVKEQYPNINKDSIISIKKAIYIDYAYFYYNKQAIISVPMEHIEQ